MSRAYLSSQEKAVASVAQHRQRGKLTVIPIDADYQLTADSQSWMIQRCKRRKARRGGFITDEWKAFSWHPTLEQAVNALADYQLRTSGVQTLADALAEVKRIKAALTRALSPRFEIKEKAA